ncbi:hypothetical protein [Piscinibacter sp.]|jgi:hypothetical protein|uniref:hypothetical protein n=1 Tax=Piscinibacter sp. TaxID=1903157 RepID=UPI00355A278A
MSIPSLSVTFVSYYAPQAASAPAPTSSTAAAATAPAPASAPADCCQSTHQGARRNVLYDAMMSALKELGLTTAAPTAAPAAAAAAPAAAAPAPAADTTAPQEAANPSPSVNDAVFKFADALFQALRGSGESTSSAGRHGDDKHHEHHEHHHRSHRSHHGYAGLAQRLEAMATSVGAASQPASASAPSTQPAVTPPAVTAPAAASASASESASVPVTAPAAPATAAPQTAISKVTDAFAAMLSALHVNTAAASNGSTAASQLGSFLHALAQALLPTAAQPAPQAQAVGLLINVTA